MPVHMTFYQRIFNRDLFVSPINYHARTTVMRRYCSDRVCFLMSILLLFYIGWYILNPPNRTIQYQPDRTEELAYKHALNASSPIIQNTQICSLDEIDLLLIIISSSSHFLERQSIRETWGSMPDLFGVHSQCLFVIGYHSGGNLYKDLLNEATHEHDLLYLTVDDQSVTLKELYAYQWLEKYCSNVVYIFKTEDDLFVNTLLLHELIRELKIKSDNIQNRYLYNKSIDSLLLAQTSSDGTKFLFGWAYLPGRPERNDTSSPYYITYKEYSEELYPRYCSGFGYLMNSKTRSKLTIEASKDPKPFRFSDIFLTGIIASRLNFPCETLPFRYFQGTTDQCIQIIKNNNQKKSFPSLQPLFVCSTGRHTGQNAYSDYNKIWTVLKRIYADRLQRTSD